MRQAILLATILAIPACNRTSEPAKPEAAPLPPKLAKPGPDKEPRYQGRTLSSWAKDLWDKDTSTRQAAANALATIGEPAAPYLEEALLSGDEPLVVEARCALQSGSRQFAATLFRGLDSPHEVTRANALFGLSFVDQRPIKILFEPDSPQMKRAKEVADDLQKNGTGEHKLTSAASARRLGF